MFIKSALSKRLLSSTILTLILSSSLFAQEKLDTATLQKLYSSQIPKEETGVLEFLKEHPTYDGREVVIAIFDTGVDPEAVGMQITSTGERKLVDVYDASGAGDVNTTTVVTAEEDGILKGLTGRSLKLPENLQNPSGKFRIGMKQGMELFHQDAWDRLMKYRSRQMDQKATQARVHLSKSVTQKPENQSLAPRQKLEVEALDGVFENYLKDIKSLDKGPVYDCVMWQDAGEIWNVIVDTDEDGDLTDETVLQPFAIRGDWASFPDYVSMNFAVQVFEDGDLLSIVTNSGSHGTHVASIAAAHFPQNPALDGIAPGAKILSIRMGDVRSGGSSTYMGETLATALAAQHKVDIMNASWGGQSFFQNANNLGVKLYNKLVKKYGVTAFVSVGNDGPALTTLGSPGGEAHAVIGVGAYVSPEMGEYLYSVVGDTPSTTFMFSARGPARNGDLGVDILAPGAAITSLAKDSLQNSDLYNGTSMSSPSAAGVGALLISGAKQTGLHTSPARIRYALMNSASALETETALQQGAGLINTQAAWDHLRTYQHLNALDLFYNVTVYGNTYSDGPGYYRREDASHFKGIQSIPVSLHPDFPSSLTNHDQYDFNLYLKGNSLANWLTVPNTVHLSNSGKTIRPELNFDLLHSSNSETQSQIHQTSWDLMLAEAPEAGPLIRIPFTIVESQPPTTSSQWLDETNFTLESSQSYQSFLTAPWNTHLLTVNVRREEDQDVEKLFVFHALTLTSNSEIEAFETRNYFRLKPGEEQTFDLSLIPGEPVEINVHQVWSYDEPTTLKLSGTFSGVLTNNDSVPVYENFRPEAPLEIRAQFDTQLDIEASLDTETYFLKAANNEITPLDRRGTFPRGRTDSEEQPSFILRQTFSVETEESMQVGLEMTQFMTEFAAGGGIIEVFDEKGFLVDTGLAPTDSDEWVTIPTGKNTLIREFVSTERSFLETLKDTPLIIKAKMDPITVQVYQGKEALSKRESTLELDLGANKRTALFLKLEKAPESASLEIRPAMMEGTLQLDEGEKTIKSIQVSANLPTLEASGLLSKTKSFPEDIDTPEALEKILYEQKLRFLQETRGTAETDAKRTRATLFKDLLKDSTDPRLWLEEIYESAIEDRLLHPWFLEHPLNLLKAAPKSEGKEATRKITKMIENCHPQKVAEYLGAIPVIEFPDTSAGKEAAKKQQNFEEISGYISEAYLLSADIQLKMEDPRAARKLYNESLRWNRNEDPTDVQLRFEIQLLKKEGFPLLALQKLQEQLKEKPQTTQLNDWKKELYKTLGWTLGTELESLYDSISENANLLR